jgi:hypothetical protein
MPSGPVTKHHNQATGGHPYADARTPPGPTATRNPDSSEADHSHPGYHSHYSDHVHITNPSKQGPMEHGEHGHKPVKTFHGSHGHSSGGEHFPSDHRGGHRHR